MALLDTIKFITQHPLNQHRKFTALYQFLKWQIVNRIAPQGIVHTWVNQAKFRVKKGETGLTGNLYTGLHEFADMAYLLHVLRKQDTFIDVGANMGSYSLLACASIGAKGVAFEPVANTYQRLTENIALNRLGQNVQCINKGVGKTSGIVRFSSALDTTNHALNQYESQEDAIEVNVISLDEALQNISPSVIKIDVEGYETPVIEGAPRILQDPHLHSVIMELNGSGKHYGFDETDILNTMQQYGFKRYAYSPFTRHLSELKGKNTHSGNTIFIKDYARVTALLKSAANINIHNLSF